MSYNSTVMNGTNEHINESSSKERRKNRRPDQCLYQPPGGRQARMKGVNSSSNLRRTQDSENFREPLRHESSSRSRTDGRDQEPHSFKTSRNSHESRRENSFRMFSYENIENKKPIKSQTPNSASSRRESDEFNRVFAPLFSGGPESTLREQEDQGPKRTTEFSPPRNRDMKQNRSLQTRNNLKKNGKSDDDDDGDNIWKSFDRSKVPVKNSSQLSSIQTPKQEHRHSPITPNQRNKIYSSRRLESPSWEKITFDLHTSDEVKDLVFVDDDDEKHKQSGPKLRNGHKLWVPEDGVPTGSRGVIQLPKTFPLKPSDPRPRKAVDPEFVRLPVIKEKSKYICIATAEQQQVGSDNGQMVPKIVKSGTANGEGQKSAHLRLDAKLAEVSERGTKLTALLRKFARPTCRADSTSDRSTSRHRSRRNDSRSLSHGSTDGVGCLSDGEVESLLKNLVQLRSAFGDELKEIIISHPEVSIKKYLCDALWKLGFYQSIEMFRRMLEDQNKFSNFLMSSTRSALRSTIAEGIKFYEGFVKDIQSKYSVNLLDPENKGALFVNSLHLYGNPTDMKLTSAQKLVSIICYQVAINVGDLERYREVQAASSEKLIDPKAVVPCAVGAKRSVDTRMFLEARWWYLKAHQIHAKFGKPFHQLAIISQLMKRRLDAVYFHLRNLHSKNPVESGREELQSIFQGVWKRVAADEKKRKLEVARRKEKMMRTFKMGSRVEVWIRPNGKREAVDISDDEMEEDTPEFLSGMDVIDLNRKFLLDYLVTIGRLYTKIGMESYKTTAVTLLQGFRVLLSSSPIIISEERLYQLLAINMAVIERHKENAVICEEVIALTMDMIGLLCECYFRLVELLDEGSENGRCSPAFGTIKELNQILGAIKVFADWMVGHVQLWSPQTSSLLETFGENKVDLWKHLINFFNSVTRVSAKLSKGPKALELTQVSFPDEEFFKGFMPLMTENGEKKGNAKAVLEEKEMAVARLSQLKAIIDALKDQEEPIIMVDPTSEQYQLCPINDCRLMKSVKNKAMKKDGSDDEDYEIDDDEDDVVIISSEMMSADESEDEKLPEEPIKVISERGLELIVKPKYVVLDTNCLVHNFRNVKILLDSNVFIIIVPLIVIKELEKLEKKGSAQHHPEDKDFNDWLKVQSRLALEFLRREFKSNNRYLRTATINGNIMTSMNFTNEDYTDAKKNMCYNNDDLILVCCTKLCQGPGNETMPTNFSDPEKKNRNVVLVTNDRILRIKAFNEEVPSRNVPKFMQWAGLSKK